MGFKWLRSPFAYDIIFARHLNFSTWFAKKLHYSRNQKRFNNGLNGNFLGNKTQPFLRVFKKSVIILVNEQIKKFNGICKNFSFLYLHIGLILQFFLRRSHVMLLELFLCVVIFKTSILNAKSHFTLMALPEHFFFHTSSSTDTTPQLRLRRGRPMFVAADFKPSEKLFSFRWST